MSEWVALNVPVRLRADDLYSAVVNSGFESEDHWSRVGFDAFGVLSLSALDPDTLRWRRRSFGRGEVVAAAVSVMEERHITELEDIDAGVGDEVMQRVAFGELVYG